MIRTAVKSTALVFAALIVALAMAEGMVRVFAPHSRDHVLPRGLFAIDSVLGWRLEPSREVRHHTRYFDVRYSTNSLGFRDRHRSRSPKPGVKRMLVFGDSQIFGWGVDLDETLTGSLESDTLEVLNLGIPGYGFDQEVLLYEKVGASLSASDVVLFLSRPLAERTRHRDKFNKPKPRFVFDSSGALVLEPVATDALRRSALLYRLLSGFYLPYFVEIPQMLIESGRIRGGPERRALTPLDPHTTRVVLALLERARRMAQERHQRLTVLATLPVPTSNIVKSFCAANGIGFVQPPWPETPVAMMHGKHDAHWTPEAHGIVARRLRAYLERADSITSTIGASSR